MRVQITLEDDDYAALKGLADEEDRTVAGQARHMLRGELGRRRGENEPLNGLTAPGYFWFGGLKYVIAGDGSLPLGPLQDPQSETAHDVHSGLTPPSENEQEYPGPDGPRGVPVASLQGEPETHDVTGSPDA